MGSSVLLPTPGQPKTGPDPSFHTPAVPNLVQFRFLDVDPPSALYLQRDDVLSVQVDAQVVPDTVIVNVRILLPFAQAGGQPDHPPSGGVAGGPVVGPGYVQTIQKAIPITTAGVAFITGIVLTEGYLLSVVALPTTATQRGDIFVRAWINRGPFAGAVPLNFYELFADYVSGTGPASWPAGRNVSPTDGAGFLTSYSPANPQPGADMNVLSNTFGRVRLQTFTATLTTSAVAGNRVPSFRLKQLSLVGISYRVQVTAPIAASTVAVFSLAPGGTNVVGGGAIATEVDITLPIPSPWLGQTGIQVTSNTQGILAGDQWSAIVMQTEEWMDGV